ncbi:hypothetical protein ACLKA6_015406 [Drosophila palustris]
MCHRYRYRIRQLRLSDETEDGDIIVNATGHSIEGFIWPEISEKLYESVCITISNMLVVSITVIISQKCLLLKLARTAEHTFYSSLGIVLCMSEALLLSDQMLHMALGLMAFSLGAMGVGIEVRHKQLLPAKHFRSKHSIFGLIGCLLILASICTGFWMLLQDLGKRQAIMLQLAHRICSLAGYVALMTSQLFSYNKGFVRRNWSELYIRVLKFFTFVATITVCIRELQHFASDVLKAIDEEMNDIIQKDIHMNRN